MESAARATVDGAHSRQVHTAASEARGASKGYIREEQAKAMETHEYGRGKANIDLEGHVHVEVQRQEPESPQAPVHVVTDSTNEGESVSRSPLAYDHQHNGSDGDPVLRELISVGNMEHHQWPHRDCCPSAAIISGRDACGENSLAMIPAATPVTPAKNFKF